MTEHTQLSESEKRYKEFNKWWKKSEPNPDNMATKKTYIKQHTLLVEDALRFINKWPLPQPEVRIINSIATKFKINKYKRLRKTDANILWDITNPITYDRLKIISINEVLDKDNFNTESDRLLKDSNKTYNRNAFKKKKKERSQKKERLSPLPPLSPYTENKPKNKVKIMYKKNGITKLIDYQ